MNERGKTFWLGLFIVGSILITSWLLLFLKPSFGDNRQTLHVYFSNIDKITKGSRVVYAGRPVGEVKAITMIPDARNGIANAEGDLYIYDLTLKVDSSVAVYSYDEIVFATSGLLGEKSIAIIPKLAPPGSPPPKNISQDILYARSTDNFEEALNQMVKVADSVDHAMKKVINFLQTNEHEFHLALQSLDTFSTKADQFFSQAIDEGLVYRVGDSFSSIQQVAEKLLHESGTFGNLLNSDCLYLQFSSVLAKFENLLHDVNNYGIFFQFTSGWKKERRELYKQMAQENLCIPCEYPMQKNH